MSGMQSNRFCDPVMWLWARIVCTLSSRTGQFILMSLLFKTNVPKKALSSSLAVAATDEPAVFELWREEMREPFIEIIEPAADNHEVTAIEVLSPTNKQPGAGRQSYINTREEYWAGGANVVEIDLLREGEPTCRVAPAKLEDLRPWHYLVTVTRRWPSRHEVYAIPLRNRLPRLTIPLKRERKRRCP